jgi:tetratricopeptide (TPR) repeat protein
VFRFPHNLRFVLFVPLVLVALLASHASLARAAESDSAREFSAASEALKRGAYTEAIDTLELLADRGFVHPDASFNRAVAYVERARSSTAAPGDLGRAAAALSEVLELRPDDDEAEAGLARIRAEISRRHSREGVAPVMARPSLSRAATSLLDENVWAALALLGSLLLTLGLALRRFVHSTSARLAGAIGIGLGTVLLGGGAALAAGARHFRLTSSPAVVVTEEARLLDESGKPLPQKRGAADSVTVPEGATVYVLERRPSFYRVEWGSSEGWVTPGQVRILATR